jgi:myo-inositol catabolism protein IolC
MQVKFVNENENMVAEVSCTPTVKGFVVGTVVFKDGEFQKVVGSCVTDPHSAFQSAVAALESTGFTIVEEI